MKSFIQGVPFEKLNVGKAKMQNCKQKAGKCKKNLKNEKKNDRLSNAFWLYQYRVKYAPFLSCSLLLLQFFKWNTLYLDFDIRYRPG